MDMQDGQDFCGNGFTGINGMNGIDWDGWAHLSGFPLLMGLRWFDGLPLKADIPRDERRKVDSGTPQAHRGLSPE